MEKLPAIKDDPVSDNNGQGKVALFFNACWCLDCRVLKPELT